MALHRSSVLVFLFIGVACLMFSAGIDAYETFQQLTVSGTEVDEEFQALIIGLMFKTVIAASLWLLVTVLLLKKRKQIAIVNPVSVEAQGGRPNPDNQKTDDSKTILQKEGGIDEVGTPVWDVDTWEKTYSSGPSVGDTSHEAGFILSSLAKLFRASKGVLYFKSAGDMLNPVSSFACSQQEEEDLGDVSFGEGLVGEVAQINKYIYLENIPEEARKIKSGLGEARPTSLLLLPLTYEGKVNGVVELASFHTFQPHDLNGVSRVSAFLGDKVHSLLKPSSN